MTKQLQPKPTSRNSEQRDQRLAMLRNGWVPIPCEGKNRIIEDWPRVIVDAAAIHRWDGYGKGGCKFLGTGVRIEAPLFVLDLDIKDQEIMNAVLAAIEAAYPQFYAGALWRDSGAVSLALFSRISEPVAGRHSITFTRLGQAGSVAEGGPVAEKAHIETYGGGTNGKYFAAFGPHALKGREYGWQGPSPADRAVSALPVFPADQVGPLHDLVEQVLGQFMEPMRPARDLGGMRNLYDLSDGMPFILVDGRTITLVRLEAELAIGTENGIRGTLSEQDYQESDSKARCHAFRRERNGRLMITDFYRDVNHYYEDEAPQEIPALDEETMAALAALRGDAEDAPETTPEIPRGVTPEETYTNAVNWLLENIAWNSQAFNGRGGAISIHPDGAFQTAITLPSLRECMMSYSFETIGERGGIKRHHPVNAWSMRPERIIVNGVRMRPELSRPLYQEGDRQFINRYTPPAHPTSGGSIRDFEAFMGRLVPNAAERKWVWNWLASKVQHPEWRMIALAMVARDMGSGRGFLAETLHYLFGGVFVVPLPYAKLSGGSGARFNAEVADKLLVYINESRDADDRKFAHKNAAREALKDFIEPNHMLPFRVEPKGLDAYTTRAAISTLIFTNNLDGLPIGEDDRRVAIVMNGPQMSVDERDRFRAWVEQPDNIGALWRHLCSFKIETDLAVFNPYMAPAFHGRDLMIDAGKTFLDDAWELAVHKIGTASDLYTMSQVVAMTRHYAKKQAHSDFDDLVRKHTIVKGHRIGIKHSTNWLVRYGEGEDNRERVYALDEAGQAKWTHALPKHVKEQLDKAQRVVDAPFKAFNKLLRGIET